MRRKQWRDGWLWNKLKKGDIHRLALLHFGRKLDCWGFDWCGDDLCPVGK